MSQLDSRSDAPARSPADRRAEAQERLIRAAIMVIAEQGYAATAVADVISRASCARATFYQHFRDIEDCLLAAVDRVGGELLAKLRHATKDLGGLDAARRFVRALVGYVSEEQVSARFLLLEALGGGPRALARRDLLIAQVEELIDDSSNPVEGDRWVLALPSAALVGGTFRLLTIRLHRSAIDRDELEPGLLAWIDAYLIPAGRRAPSLKRFSLIEPPPVVEVSSIGAPAPLPHGRHRLDAGAVARNQRERILHATIQSIYQHTYAATTVQDIVVHAGVSRRAFYRHFHDRQQAATEAHELIFERGMVATATAFFAASGWPERVWAAGHALISFLAANPAMALLGFVEFHAISPAAIQQAYDRLAAWSLFLQDGYSYREQPGELPPLCFEAIAAVIFEFAYRTIRLHPGGAELPTMLPVSAYVCLAPFLGPGEATDLVTTMTERASFSKGGPADADPTL